MFVTEEEYDRWPSDMWEAMSREGGRRHTCDNCAHYGCCVDLHHCGGTGWEAVEEEIEDV